MIAFGTKLDNLIKEYKLEEIKLVKRESSKVWRDEDTGLMWQVDIEVKKYKWDDIQKVPKRLNKENYGDYDDWRVPTIKELKTIITEEGYENKKSYSNKIHMKQPLLKNMNMNFSVYWSSSEHVSGSSNTWFVNFDSGYTAYNSKSNEYYVRCVRGRE